MNHLAGSRDASDASPVIHAVSGRPLLPPWPEGLEEAQFAMGCFWGAERLFWQTPGVWVTAAGYAGGDVHDPDYEAVCSGQTGHAETVRVIYDPKTVSYAQLLTLFWENHDPTQGMRQGNDVGAQYRSVIFTSNAAQERQALASRDRYQGRLDAKGLGKITTQIVRAGPFYLAEDYHQQYLAKNPDGYCGLKGTGVACAI